MKLESIVRVTMSVLLTSTSLAMRISYGDWIFDDQNLEYIRKRIDREDKNHTLFPSNEMTSQSYKPESLNQTGGFANRTFKSIMPNPTKKENGTYIPLRYKFDFGQYTPRTEIQLDVTPDLGETVVSMRKIKNTDIQKLRAGRMPEMDFGENYDLGQPVTSGTLYVSEKPGDSGDNKFEETGRNQDDEVSNLSTNNEKSLEFGEHIEENSHRITDAARLEALEGIYPLVDEVSGDTDNINEETQKQGPSGNNLYYFDDAIDETNYISKNMHKEDLETEEKNRTEGYHNELSKDENQKKTTRLYQYRGNYADRLWYKSGNLGKPETTKLFPIEGFDDFDAKIQEAKQNLEESRLRDVFLSVQNGVENPNEIETHRTEEELGRYIGQLKSFITYDRFNTRQFDSQKQELWQELSVLDETSMSLKKSKSIVDQLRFAKHLFEVMNEAAYQIKVYGVQGSFEHALVNCLINLNIGLYSLYNSYGDPDPEIEGFRDVVLLEKSYLELWKHMFELLPVTSDRVKSKFAEQHFEAKYKLKWFESLI